MTLYPIGYGTELVTLEELITREMGHGMLPEAQRRHIALIVDRGGELGIGDGWRPTPSNTSEASKKGQSFHQTQTFADGTKGWVAIDFVCRNPSGGKHVAPVTGVIPVQGTKESRVWGIHANVGTPGQSGWEPWHGQPIELDGWQTWVNAGRPNIQQNYPLPGDSSKPDPLPPSLEEDVDMLALDFGTPGKDSWWCRLTYTGAELVHVVSPADQLQARGNVACVSISETELNALLDTVQTIGPSPFGPGQAPNEALDVKWTQARGRT